MQNFQKLLMMMHSGHQAAAALANQTHSASFPNYAYSAKYFSIQNLAGGTGKKLDLKSMTLNLNKSKQQLPFATDKEYDCIVIGGGTGGLSFA